MARIHISAIRIGAKLFENAAFGEFDIGYDEVRESHQFYVMRLPDQLAEYDDTEDVRHLFQALTYTWRIGKDLQFYSAVCQTSTY